MYRTINREFDLVRKQTKNVSERVVQRVLTLDGLFTVYLALQYGVYVLQAPYYSSHVKDKWFIHNLYFRFINVQQ